MPPTSSAEATIRLGDAYTAYPKRANVISEVWGNVRHRIDHEIEQYYRSPSAYSGGLGGSSPPLQAVPMPEQATTLSFMTTGRCLEVEVASLALPEALSLAAQIETSEGWHATSIGGDDEDNLDDYSDPEPINQALHSQSSGRPGALSNVGSGVGKATVVAATGIYNILTLGGILPSAIEAAAGGSGVEAANGEKAAAGAAGGRSLDDKYTMARRRWMVEKANLEATIRQLEGELGR